MTPKRAASFLFKSKLKKKYFQPKLFDQSGAKNAIGSDRPDARLKGIIGGWDHRSGMGRNTHTHRKGKQSFPVQNKQTTTKKHVLK